MDILLMLPIAVIVDLAFGDPKNALHPVYYMGHVIGFIIKFGDKWGKFWQYVWGMLVTLLTAALFVVPFIFLFLWLKEAAYPLYIILGGIFLSLFFSVKQLKNTALAIKKMLDETSLEQARFELRALVSRNTSKLNKKQLSSAAVESVAESLCDSVVAPLFFFCLLGFPGIIAYRAVNTADSMIGYRGKYEYLGKFAAVTDDVLNFIPARLAMLCTVGAAYLYRQSSAKRAWKIAMRDGKSTSSPNAGYPMAAMAGALGVQLEKIDHYQLGDEECEFDTAVISKSTRLLYISSFIWFSVCLVFGGILLALS